MNGPRDDMMKAAAKCMRQLAKTLKALEHFHDNRGNDTDKELIAAYEKEKSTYDTMDAQFQEIKKAYLN